MYVHWKTLIGFGIILWLSLCVYDAYFIDPITKLYRSNSDEFDWLSQVSEKEIIHDTSPPREDDIILPLESQDSLGILNFLFWSVITFLGTLSTCYGIKCVSPHILNVWQTYRHNQSAISNQQDDTDIVFKRRNVISKIPVMISSKTSLQYQDEDKLQSINEGTLESGPSFLSTSSASSNINVRQSKSEVCSRMEQHLEKQCVKLKDDLLSFQASSIKEHAILSRKLEQVLKEKREMCKLLMICQKENRGAKQQIKELLDERGLLLSRLECASKEFRANTRAKKEALQQLEEAQATIVSLKQQIDKVTREKEMAEEKMRCLESDTYVKATQLTESRINEEIRKRGERFRQDGPSQKTLDFTDIKQSHKDVQRMQLRLMDLERNLDRLKTSRWNEKSESKMASEKVQTELTPTQIIWNNENVRKQESEMNEGRSEKSEGFLSKNDNLTDEQRRKILNSTDPSNVSESSASEAPIQDPFERVGKYLKFIKSNPPTPRNGRFNVSSVNLCGSNNDSSTTTSPQEDEDTPKKRCSPIRNRFVTNSLAFQQFLKSMEPPDRKKKFVTSTTHVIF